MPYISKDNIQELTMGGKAVTPGELNYQITMLCVQYLYHHELQYVTINDILGALEGAKQEFYRRVAVPYEDEKIKQNGDVYPNQESDNLRSGRR